MLLFTYRQQIKTNSFESEVRQFILLSVFSKGKMRAEIERDYEPPIENYPIKNAKTIVFTCGVYNDM